VLLLFVNFCLYAFFLWCRNGKVARGVLDILKELPVVKVGVGDLPGLVGNPGMFLRHLYMLRLMFGG
jgi:hypothetical protein